MTSFPHTKLTLPNIRGTARNARTGFVCFFTIFPSLKKTIYLAFVITYHRCLLFQQPKTTAFILRSYHLDDNKDNIWTSRQALDVRQNDAHGDNNNKKRWTCYSEAEKKIKKRREHLFFLYITYRSSCCLWLHSGWGRHSPVLPSVSPPSLYAFKMCQSNVSIVDREGTHHSIRRFFGYSNDTVGEKKRWK